MIANNYKLRIGIIFIAVYILIRIYLDEVYILFAVGLFLIINFVYFSASISNGYLKCTIGLSRKKIYLQNIKSVNAKAYYSRSGKGYRIILTLNDGTEKLLSVQEFSSRKILKEFQKQGIKCNIDEELIQSKYSVKNNKQLTILAIILSIPLLGIIYAAIKVDLKFIYVSAIFWAVLIIVLLTSMKIRMKKE